MSDDRVLPLPGLVLQTVLHIDEPYDVESDHYRDRYTTEDVDKAQVITSRVADSVSESERHKAVIDIDLPAKLIESSTPGHFHLYIDHEMSWEAYANLLAALRDAGIVEPGYVSASIDRGYTAVRLPWVRKTVINDG